MTREMIEFLLATLGFAGTVTAALATYFRFQGDCKIYLETEAARDFSLTHHPGEEGILCRCTIPVTNGGKQQGMLLNVFCQPMYCGKIMEQLEIIPSFRLLREPYRHGYWEAVIVKKQTTMMAELELKIRYQGELEKIIKEVPRLSILIHYQAVGRSGFQWRVAEVKFDLYRLKRNKGEQNRCQSK